MASRDRAPQAGDVPAGEEVARPSRPSPGKIASSSLIGNPNPPRYQVSPGKRTLTMRLEGPDAAMAEGDDVATRVVESGGRGRPVDGGVRARDVRLVVAERSDEPPRDGCCCCWA